MSIIGNPVASGSTSLSTPITPPTFPTTTGSAASKLAIINMALVMLQTNPAQSLDQGTPHLTAALTFYDSAVDEVLRAHRWNFALRRITLPRMASAPVFGYRYAYQLPEDCLRVLVVSSARLESESAAQSGAYGYEPPTDPLLYRVEADQIVTNEETLYLRYVARLTDPTRYDALFIDALTANLAMKLAYALAGTSSQQELLTRLYGDYLAQARSVSADEQTGPDTWGDSSGLVTARDAYRW